MPRKVLANLALAFDTETTGLTNNRTMKLDRQPEIIELYGAVFSMATGKVLSEIEMLIKPSHVIDEKDKKGTFAITGINNAMVADKPPFAAVADSIKAFFENDDVQFVTAHNAAFDREMVDIEMERCGRKVKWPRIMCTVEQTIHLKGFRLSLSDLHAHLFGQTFAGAHRARIDVQAQMKCIVELRKRGLL